MKISSSENIVKYRAFRADIEGKAQLKALLSIQLWHDHEKVIEAKMEGIVLGMEHPT